MEKPKIRSRYSLYITTTNNYAYISIFNFLLNHTYIIPNISSDKSTYQLLFKIKNSSTYQQNILNIIKLELIWLLAIIFVDWILFVNYLDNIFLKKYSFKMCINNIM